MLTEAALPVCDRFPHDDSDVQLIGIGRVSAMWFWWRCAQSSIPSRLLQRLKPLSGARFAHNKSIGRALIRIETVGYPTRINLEP